MAKTLNVSHDTLVRCLYSPRIQLHALEEGLITKANKTAASENEKLILVIDEVLISKEYSRLIKGSSDIYNHVARRVIRSVCAVFAIAVIGEMAIPLTFKLYFHRDYDSKQHKTKRELALIIIQECIKLGLKIDHVAADAHYATKMIVSTMKSKEISFVSRAKSNYSIDIDGVVAQIKNHSKLKLNKNAKMLTVKAIWGGQYVFITTIKLKKSFNEYEYIYLISTYEGDAKKVFELYKKRWKIEMFFRTAKQSLGMTDCQCRSKDSQVKHLCYIMCAYVFLQFECIKSKLANIEDTRKLFQELKIDIVMQELNRSDWINYVAA
jgi:SRSO17 transposase